MVTSRGESVLAPVRAELIWSQVLQVVIYLRKRLIASVEIYDSTLYCGGGNKT
jgi:hypothetical protein